MKICLLGDKCGKTSIVQKWISPIKPIQKENTIGIDMKTITMCLDEKMVRVQMWDCSGEKYYANLLDEYINNSHVIVICFDLTKSASFDTAKVWAERIQKMHKSTVVCMLANKLDLESKRVVKDIHIKNFVNSMTIPHAFYTECSAFTGENCKKSLYMIVREGMRSDKVYTIDDFKIAKPIGCIVV